MNKKNRRFIFALLVSLFVLSGCTNTATITDVKNEVFSHDSYVVVDKGDDGSEIANIDSEQVPLADQIAEAVEQFTTEVSETPDTLETPETPSDSIQQMEVHFISIGQGDATLIKCGDEYMLIDCGEDSQGTYLQNYIKKQGGSKLKTLIVTHPDSDHCGASPVIIQKFDIDNIYMSSYTKTNKTYDKMMSALKSKNYKFVTPNPGDTTTLGSAVITFVAPNKTYDTPNNSSIALLIKNGNNTFLFTGDCEKEAESDILTNGMDIKADVYQVGHHGSATSTTKKFLGAVSPTYAVISCGEGNKHGHPRAETLNKFLEAGIKMFRTDKQGTVIAYSNGTDITWNMSPSDDWTPGEPEENSENANNPISQETINAQDNGNTPTAQETVEPVVVNSNARDYTCNTNTMKFHYPTCASAKKIKDSNRKDVNCTREELIGQGYQPCKNCNP